MGCPRALANCIPLCGFACGLAAFGVWRAGSLVAFACDLWGAMAEPDDESSDGPDGGETEDVFWSKENPHPCRIPWEKYDAKGVDGSSGRYQRDEGGHEPVRLSSFKWEDITDEHCRASLESLPDEKLKVEAETMETSGRGTVRAHALKVSTPFYAGTDLGSIPLIWVGP